jgi:pimeloyl-ACP methyl ester carboxylesterase
MDIARLKIATKRGSIVVYEIGSGEPLVFLGGYSQPFALADYYGIIEKLSETYHVILIDLMGYGNSDIASEKWGFSKNLAVLSEVFAKLALQRFSIIGHSLGGNYALCYALQHPDEIEGVILLDTFPYMNKLLISANSIFFYFIKRRVKNIKRDGQITYKQIAEKMGYPTDAAKDVPIEIIAELEALANTIFLNQNVTDELSDVSRTLATVFMTKPTNVPCLAFCRSSTYSSIKRLKRRHFPNTEIVHLGKTSHHIHVYNMVEVVKKILEWRKS